MNENILFYAAIAAALPLFLLLRRGGWLGASPAEGSRLRELGDNIRLRDLFRLAVMIEEEGLAFYLKMEAKVSRPDTKKLCAALAGEEAAHRNLFKSKLSGWRQLNPNRATWPVFLEKVKKEGFFAAPPGENSSEDQLAAYAIRQEAKTAEFYQLFEKAFPEAWKRANIRELVAEERSHEARLRAAYPHIP